MARKKIETIAKISVAGFKSISKECEIEICPLTILAGANSSGKSSIMQPLLMLKQTLEAPYDPGPLLIDGTNVQFTLTDQFFSTLVNKDIASRFQIQIETGMPNLSHSVKTIFGKGETGIEIVEMEIKRKTENDKKSQTSRMTLYPGMPPEEIKTMNNQDSVFQYLVKDLDVVQRSGCFLYLESKDGDKRMNFTTQLAFNIVNTIHLPGLRGNPERTYKLTSTGPKYPGTFEHYAASVIYEWQESGDEHLKAVTNALRTLELTGYVAAKKIGDIGIEVKVDRLPYASSDKTDTVNIADVGFGVSQVLPVIVALIAAEPGQLVYIEQPELHLHPNAQVKLAQVMAEAAKRGVRVVAETHSSLLLLGIQTLVAEGKLSPELVKLHWFSRNEEGITEVDSVELDEAGTYGEWSVDFNDISLNLQSRFLNAVDNVRFSNKEGS